eukprot:gene586-biopygen326
MVEERFPTVAEGAAEGFHTLLRLNHIHHLLLRLWLLKSLWHRAAWEEVESCYQRNVREPFAELCTSDLV